MAKHLFVVILAGVCAGALGCDGTGSDPCDDDPCVHGTCTADGEDFSCACDGGWEGELCDQEEGPCERLTAEAPLHIVDTGNDVGDTATYQCDEGYELDGDEVRTCGEEGWDGAEPTCIAGPCLDAPCENGATCVDDGEGGYACECADGYEGEHCEIDIDDCDPDPCQNGGTCLDAVAGYACDCSDAPGWQGTDCDEDIPDCAAEPCEHGTCAEGTPGTGEYTCECDPGWTGDICSLPTDPCEPNPCLNAGTCASGGTGAFTCTCADGFEGDTCETNVDDCDPNPCLNGGTCADGVDTFTCTCADGWSGETCDRAVASCSDHPCIHATSCTDTGVGTWTCACEAGWEGDNCETNIDDCTPNPCLHGGGCVDAVASYTCDCTTAAGWEGADCDVMTDMCSPNPCLHGGTCSMPGAGLYECACIDGYTGDSCEVDPPTTHCVLTYDLDVGNGADDDGWTGSNMRIRDTFWHIGDTTAAVGPGTLVIRVPSDGGSNPAPGAAEILYYHLIVEFTTTAGATIVTDVDAASPELGMTTNDIEMATGVLSMGGTPSITWGTCTLPSGWNASNSSYTPDVDATGEGCLDPYRSTGNVRCTAGMCSAGGMDRDTDYPQDETWEQRLEVLTFSADMTTFTMPFMQVPNRSDSRTYVSWAGTRASVVCE